MLIEKEQIVICFKRATLLIVIHLNTLTKSFDFGK